MANPVGESNWLAYLEESARNASDLEHRVNLVELYKRAVSAEPGSLRLWLSYCEFFQSLWERSNSSDAGWSEDEQLMGQELFSLDSTLDLWQQGYEAIQYRLSDSHQLWNRWISLQVENFRNKQTPELLNRVTRLYRDRLATPHLTWEETSQSFSSFLSEYNPTAWEDTMKEITANAQEPKRAAEARDPFELKLKQAERNGHVEAQKTLLRDYLDWEVRGTKRNQKDTQLSIRLCSGLFDRALTGLFATDEDAWQEYMVFLSSTSDASSFPARGLDASRRAVQHCPRSGQLWSRYIQCAEEAGLPFDQVESIKDAATVDAQLCKDGMESMIVMYSAWCSYLRRTAIKETDNDRLRALEAGLKACMDLVMKTGKKLYGKDFQGDPKYRLERIYIQYLTETKVAHDEARAVWNKLEQNAIHANSYDFWFNRYTWEMFVFASNHPRGSGYKTPSMATVTLRSAATRESIDWPEKILEVYSQHCSLYETPEVLRQASDFVHQTHKVLRYRRKREEEAQTAQYAAYYEAQAKAQAQAQAQAEVQPQEQPGAETASSPSGSKRKRKSLADTPQDDEVSGNKRQRNSHEAVDGESTSQPAKRDRENSTILVTNLPYEATQTEVRKYFRPYGHINNITAFYKDEQEQTTTALIEYRSTEEAQSALLRDAKYFGESQISVQPGHDLTVYIANFPPAADEKYIRDLFRDCGEILSIRWPSLKVNAHRRFCYLSFFDREASAKAVAKEGRLLDGKFKLLAKYSNPNRKKSREGAIAEGREVHISNLDQAASEAEIRDVFGKFGTVQRVNIPQNMAGQNRGFAFLDFGTKEQASKAVEELNNTKFRSQIIKAEVSKENKVKPTAKSSDLQRVSASPAPPDSIHDDEGDEALKDAAHSNDKPLSSDIAARTIALMGLPDIVNDARVRALVEPLGPITKLIHQPGHGGAIIEFADVRTAGKAALQLNSMEYEGHKLRTGSPDELRQNRPGNKGNGMNENERAQKDEKPKGGLMRPPQAVRRSAQGRAGPKRALGFAPRKAASSSGASHPTATVTESGAPGAQKSNADFKAMFLAGKKEDGPRAQNE